MKEQNIPFKTLYDRTKNQFVHFDLSPIEDKVIFSYSDLPMIMEYDINIDDLMAFLGGSTPLPEGTELRIISTRLIDEVIEVTSIEEFDESSIEGLEIKQTESTENLNEN